MTVPTETDRDFRIRRYSHVPRGKDRQAMPSDTRGKYNVMQWLMFQMASVGPMLGQAHYFRVYAPEKLELAINRYTNEAKRILRRDRQAVQPNALHSGRIFDCRHRDLSVADNAQHAGAEPRPHTASEEVLRGPPRASRSASRLRPDGGSAKSRLPTAGPMAWDTLFGAKQFEKR